MPAPIPFELTHRAPTHYRALPIPVPFRDNFLLDRFSRMCEVHSHLSEFAGRWVSCLFYPTRYSSSTLLLGGHNGIRCLHVFLALSERIEHSDSPFTAATDVVTLTVKVVPLVYTNYSIFFVIFNCIFIAKVATRCHYKIQRWLAPIAGRAGRKGEAENFGCTPAVLLAPLFNHHDGGDQIHGARGAFCCNMHINPLPPMEHYYTACTNIWVCATLLLVRHFATLYSHHESCSALGNQ